ncbi:MAG: SAM-dependent methyltransferase [Polyangiaceae bacterium]
MERRSRRPLGIRTRRPCSSSIPSASRRSHSPISSASNRIWVLSFLHRGGTWSATVQPPRGPRLRRSLFATRSPDRPNPLGLSAVRLVRIEGTNLHVRGIDLLEGTPILDIKPYVPYADAFADAKAGWIDAIPFESPQVLRYDPEERDDE